MKKILFIGAGYLQSFVIRKAKELGYYVHAIDKNPNSIGFHYADEFEAIDIIDQEACLNYARKKDINGVLTAATDYGVLSASYVAQELNLIGLNSDVAKVIKNKFLVRKKQRLISNKDNQIFEIYNLGNLENIRKYINFPVMVKPCDGSGSKAASRVDNFQELEKACLFAIESSVIRRALIEPFVIGKEYGVETFVFNERVHILGVMGKHMTNPPDYAELGHYYPSLLDEEDSIKKVVTDTIHALGINYGAINMDVLISDDGKVNIVDIGARMGGNLIGSHIIPIGSGHDYMTYLIKSAVGDQFEIKSEGNHKSISTRLLALSPGTIRQLPDFDLIQRKYNVEILHHLQVGATIREYHNNLDGWGYVVAKADDFETAESAAENAKEMINSRIIRE